MDVLTRQPALAKPVIRAIDLETVAPAGVVAAAACCAAVWIAFQLLQRDDGLGTPAYDQAFFQQLVWNLDHGRGFVSSFNHNSFLGLHFEPLLVVPAALELLWSDPRMLSVINAVSVALAAPTAFVFLNAAFSSARLGSYLAAGLAAALPFTPTMQEVARAGFHTETLAFPAVLIAGWAGLTQRPILMWVSAAIPLAAKEDQGYAVAAVGLLIAVLGHPRMRRHGLLLVAAAIVWGVALFGLIMPALRAGAPQETGKYYIWLGTFPGALLAPIHEPAVVWAQLTNAEGWLQASALIVCLGGLALLRPQWLLLMLPPLFANLLSRHYPQPELHLQYALTVVAPALVATAAAGPAAVVLVQRFLQPRFAALALAAAVPGLLLGATVGSIPPGGHASVAFARQPGLNQLLTITAILPQDAPVGADDDVAPPLASRTRIYVLPSLRPDCYVVVDRVRSLQSFMTADERAALLAGLPANRRLLADDGRFQVWSPVGG